MKTPPAMKEPSKLEESNGCVPVAESSTPKCLFKDPGFPNLGVCNYGKPFGHCVEYRPIRLFD
jgi:hypothetical protein